MLTRRAFMQSIALTAASLRFPRFVTPAVTEQAPAQAWGFPLAFPAYFAEAPQAPPQRTRREWFKVFLTLVRNG